MQQQDMPLFHQKYASIIEETGLCLIVAPQLLLSTSGNRGKFAIHDKNSQTLYLKLTITFEFTERLGKWWRFGAF